MSKWETPRTKWETPGEVRFREVIQLDKDWIEFGALLSERRSKNQLADIDEEEMRFLFDIYRREHQ